MSVLPRCICDPMEALVGKYDPRCNRHSSISSPVYDKRVEQLAYVMSFLHSLGFDLETVKQAADAWWAMKAGPGGVALGAKPMSETGWPYNEKIQCAKRIMAAVDAYHARPDDMNRTALRGVVLTELEEYAAGVETSDKEQP